MLRFPRLSILLCAGILCAGVAEATELEGEFTDGGWAQLDGARDFEAVRRAAIRSEMLHTSAPVLASGFDRQAPLHPLRFSELTRSDAPEQASAVLVAIPMLHRLAEAGLGTRPFSSQWYTSAHTESFPLVRLERLGLFGAQQKYRTLRGSISVGFEAGAALRLRDHLNLTAGYRMLGYGLGEQGTLEGGNLDATMNAPFLGVAFNY